MGDLVRFESELGVVLVEENDGADLERVGLLDRVRPAAQRLESALTQVRPAVNAALAAVRGLPSAPDEVEVEIGVKLTAEAGAIIARTATEGHVVLRLVWKATPAAGPASS
jgi:hypothetical protein